jgi:hypothetical protein
LKFDLAVPSAATNLVLTAEVGGLPGETNLTLRFTTTPTELARCLTAGRFGPGEPIPEAVPRSVGGETECLSAARGMTHL